MYCFSTLATPSLQVETLSDHALALGNHLRSFCPHVRRAASTVRAPRTRSLARCGWRCGCKCEALRCRSQTPQAPTRHEVLCFFVVLIDAMLLCVVGLHVAVRLPPRRRRLACCISFADAPCVLLLVSPASSGTWCTSSRGGSARRRPAPSPSSSSALAACRQ